MNHADPFPPSVPDDGSPPLHRLGQVLHATAEALRRRGVWIVFGLIGGLIGGALVALSAKPAVPTIRYYKATTTLSLQQAGPGHNGIQPVDWSMQLAQLALLSPTYQKQIAKELTIAPAVVRDHLQGLPSTSSMSFQVTAITTDSTLASRLSFAVANGLNDEINRVATRIALYQYSGASYELALAKKRQATLLATIEADPSGPGTSSPEYQAVQNHYSNLYSYVSTYDLRPKSAHFEIISAPRAIEINPTAYLRRWLNSSVDFGTQTAFSLNSSVATVPNTSIYRKSKVEVRKAETDLTDNSVPPPIQPIGLGALAGLVMGGAAVVLGEAWDDRFHDAEGAMQASGFRILAEIPHLSARTLRSLVSNDPPIEARQALTRYQGAAAMVAVDLGIRPTRSAHALAPREEPSGARRAPVVLVTSPNPAEGKSTSSAALARGFADLGLDVLAVNGDFHRSSLRKILRPVPDLVHPGRPESTVIERTWFIDTRRRGHASTPLMVAELSSIIERWRDHFDVIVLDTPPMLATNDATEFLHHAESVVLVARAGQTTTATLERASNLLRRFQVSTPGLIVSDIPRSVVDRTYGSTDFH